MKTKTKPPEKKQAAAPTTAPTIERHVVSYPKATPVSTLKIIIGGLLLFGDKNHRRYWPFFEAMLRQYVDLRTASQSSLDKPGATKTANRGIG